VFPKSGHSFAFSGTAETGPIADCLLFGELVDKRTIAHMSANDPKADVNVQAFNAGRQTFVGSFTRLEVQGAVLHSSKNFGEHEGGCRMQECRSVSRHAFEMGILGKTVEFDVMSVRRAGIEIAVASVEDCVIDGHFPLLPRD